jgi:hypothetical protein
MILRGEDGGRQSPEGASNASPLSCSQARSCSAGSLVTGPPDQPQVSFARSNCLANLAALPTITEYGGELFVAFAALRSRRQLGEFSHAAETCMIGIRLLQMHSCGLGGWLSRTSEHAGQRTSTHL